MERPIPTISIVVPVFNEEESIQPLYRGVKQVLDELDTVSEVIFVDDGSTDRTHELLAELCEDDPTVRVVRLRKNFGQSAALGAGFDHARGDVIVTMDGDLQNDPRDIPVLLDKLSEGYDIVSGWRKHRNDPLLAKRLPSKLANKLASVVTGVSLHDFGCTLKAYRREVIERIHLYSELHRFIPALAASMGVRIAEVEVAHHARRYGKSKYGVGRMVRGLLDLISLRLLSSFMNRPMQMFGALGALSLALGALTGTAVLVMKVFAGVDMTGNPLLYMTALLVFSCVQFFGLGFLGELNTRTYHETQGKPIYLVREVIGSLNGTVTRDAVAPASDNRLLPGRKVSGSGSAEPFVGLE